MATSTHSSGQQRDTSLDVLKGIGILLVVIGHVFGPPVSKLIYTFHMPLFFFVGGYLSRPQTNPLGFSGRKASQLLVPYFVFLVLFLGIQSLIALADAGDIPDVSFGQYLYGGERLTGWFSVFWFPTCYFFSVCLYAILQRHCSNRVIWSLTAVMLILAGASQYLIPEFSLPLAANVVLVSVPIFHFGAQYRALEPIIQRFQGLHILIAAAAVIYLCLVLFVDAPVMAMKRASYGWPGITLLASLACTLSILNVSRAISAKAPIFTSWFAYCGTASLTVMYLHQPIHFALKDEVGLYNIYALTLASIIVPLFAHALFTRSSLTRWILLGQRRQVGRYRKL